ncbi:cAMP-binding domain of CRP or a regulatory subunit of cAMP-dependent protein kinases [Devosia lucknowensis]|uniref:cAMP-binding domain of CRP or a regulatory subunit of cAMP-dependent protein kinases n=1 Tax=Devosia lucknowensis TaxID=1096929 RepID=A0A1Y6ET54_9HYPH|nr:Crp/Fnr family transcriptional regulator [Devosia lucknowensis]SMQ63343.1 cAMP-binding domain of CRP or a regulatory subunit of cAMP-dependent protein kinases [Devosia lucknowensis]
MPQPLDVLIAKLDAIGRLSPEGEAAIRQLPVRVAHLERGEDAVMEGQVMGHCCVVLQGLLHRHKHMQDGSRQILSFHPSGDIPDLQSLHLKRVDYTLSATTPSEIGLIRHADMQAMLRAYPTLTDLFWRDTLIDSAKFLTWMMLIGQASAEARMAHLFCEMFMRLKSVGTVEGNEFPFRATQNDLADALGMSIVHANRTLQELRSAGLLAFSNGVAEILDWPKLRALGQFDPAYLHLSRD